MRVVCEDKGGTYRVALSPLRPEASFLDVQLAVVGAGDQVDQVDVAVVLEPVVLRHQHPSPAPSFLLHLVGSVKLLLQHCANLELRWGSVL